VHRSRWREAKQTYQIEGMLVPMANYSTRHALRNGGEGWEKKEDEWMDDIENRHADTGQYQCRNGNEILLEFGIISPSSSFAALALVLALCVPCALLYP
jgi:hypothetical protein